MFRKEKQFDSATYVREKIITTARCEANILTMTTFSHVIHHVLEDRVVVEKILLWNILFMAPRIKMIVNFKLTLKRVFRKE